MTATKAYLGKALFWDEQLSSTQTVACGTCHSGAGGGVDKRTAMQRTRSTNPGFDGVFGDADDVFGSPGVAANNFDGTLIWSNSYGFREQVTGKRAMPYTDAAYANSLFWDGRATATFSDPLTNQVILQNGAALESQVLGPPVADVEMAHSGRNWQQVADRISGAKPLALAVNVPVRLKNWIDGRTYPQLFEEAFGTPEVTPARIAMAIATHTRTLFSDQTQFDHLMLYTESSRVPQISGAGRAGAGNLVPQVYAIEPQFAGNPSFTVGIANALGGAQAILMIDSSDPGGWCFDSDRRSVHAPNNFAFGHRLRFGFAFDSE